MTIVVRLYVIMIFIQYYYLHTYFIPHRRRRRRRRRRPHPSVSSCSTQASLRILGCEYDIILL